MSKQKRPPATGLRNRKVQLFAGAVVVVGLVSGGVAASLTRSPDHPAAQPQPTPTGTPGDMWFSSVVTDFSSLGSALVPFLTTLKDWRAGKDTDTQMATAAKTMLVNVSDTQTALAARKPFYPAPRAIYNYRTSADLYGQAAALAVAAAAAPAGELRTQLQLAVSRVQSLGDRVFDQGATELKPFTTPEKEYEAVERIRAAEIPSFKSSNLAAGPPLTDVGSVPTPRAYQSSRPEQSAADWVKLAQSAKIPSAADTEHAIDAGAAQQLSADSVSFTHASDLLYDAPDPQGERLVGTRVQLALLVDAEATQMGQAATLVPAAQHDALLHVAQALELIGDKMWDDRLGARTSAYPDSLLTIKQ